MPQLLLNVFLVLFFTVHIFFHLNLQKAEIDISQVVLPLETNIIFIEPEQQNEQHVVQEVRVQLH
jgi:hypothetical protein